MTDENKQPNKIDEINAKTATLSVSDITLFKDNPRLAYLYKKTEKLVSALYLLSSFISDKEPVKWQMREAGIELLAQSLSLSDKLFSERMLAYNNFISTALKFLSYLEVSYLGGIISEMNYNILKHEFEGLIQSAESGGQGSDSKSLMFPEHFFKVPEISSTPIQDQNQKKISVPEVAPVSVQNTVSDRLSVIKIAESVKQSEVKKKNKSNRQDVIITLLKKNNELGIKDFVSSIKGCSEKTIQRELVSLVSKGLVKKEGEKRWSRYSIKA